MQPVVLARSALIVYPGEVFVYRRIPLPLDGSPPSECAARFGLGLAQGLQASLVLVHRVEPQRFSDAPSYAERVARARKLGEALLHEWYTLAQNHKIPVSMVLREGANTAQIIYQASLTGRCDLIAMGTHGRTKLPYMTLGSVAQEVVSLARQPVWLVRKPASTPNPMHVKVQSPGHSHPKPVLDTPIKD